MYCDGVGMHACTHPLAPMLPILQPVWTELLYGYFAGTESIALCLTRAFLSNNRLGVGYSPYVTGQGCGQLVDNGQLSYQHIQFY